MGNLGRAPSSGNCTDEAHFQYTLFPAVYTIVFVLGLTGNVSALCIFIKKTKKASPSFIYIANLIVVDIIYICTLPFRIHYHMKHNNWVFGDVTCRITGTLYYANVYLSVTFLSLICLDRYIAVVYPRKYLRVRGSRVPRVVAALVWLLALAIMLPLVTGGTLNNAGTGNSTACFENFDAKAWSEWMAAYNIIAFFFGFFIPFTIIIIFYPLAARKIARLKSSVHRDKALRMIWAIMVISILCLVPYHVTHVFYVFGRLEVIEDCAFRSFLYKSRRVTMALVSLTCCLDPLIYFFATNKFRPKYSTKRRSQKVYSVALR